jgi:hypothetical protein
MAGAPVAAIGGILAAEQVRATAACGVAAVCVVRALGAEPRLTVPPLLVALHDGRHDSPLAAPALLHPTLAITRKAPLAGAS